MPSQHTYQQLVARVRKLDRRESLYVIWSYAQLLQQRGFRMPRDIEVGRVLLEANPMQTIVGDWSLEILTREVIKHAGEEARGGLSLRRWETFSTTLDLLRQLDGEIYAEYNEPAQIHLELMRISHQQFVWQRDGFSHQFFGRYRKIFDVPAINEMCLQHTGLSVRTLFLIGTLYMGHYVDSFVCDRVLAIEIRGLTQSDFERFLAIASCSQRELARLLRGDHALDERFKYKYSSLRQFPLVSGSFRGRDQLLCPQPTLLFWRFTQGLYYSLQQVAGFPTAFGASFETYVGEVLDIRLSQPRFAVLPAEQYHVGRNRKDTVDWIVSEAGASTALFIECKTMRLTWNSKAGLTDLRDLAQDIRKLAGAVVQLYKSVLDYEAGRYPNLPFDEDRRIFPVVATLEDWIVFGEELPTRLDREVRTALRSANLDDGLVDRVPFTIMSVNELETAAGIVNLRGIATVMTDKVTDRELRRWSMETYLMQRFPAERGALPDLFPDAIADAFPEMR
jgi:hypothetical protein